MAQYLVISVDEILNVVDIKYSVPIKNWNNCLPFRQTFQIYKTF